MQSPNPYDAGLPQAAPPQRRSQIIIMIGLAAGLIVLACCGLSAAAAMNKHHDDNAGSRKKPSRETNIGIPARDGKFEFTVRSIDCSKNSIKGRYVEATAQGRFCIVTIIVRNIGTTPQTFLSANQKLLANGTQYAADSTAGMYATEDRQSTWISEINPGNGIEGPIVFDVPANVNPDRLELHDSVFSSGVTVHLS